jgi:hypothetical protein
MTTSAPRCPPVVWVPPSLGRRRSAPHRADDFADHGCEGTGRGSTPIDSIVAEGQVAVLAGAMR